MLAHDQRPIGRACLADSARSAYHVQHVPVRCGARERGSEHFWGLTAQVSIWQCYLSRQSLTKVKTTLRQRRAAKQDVTAILDVPQGKFTHPPFGRARPKKNPANGEQNVPARAKKTRRLGFACKEGEAKRRPRTKRSSRATTPRTGRTRPLETLSLIHI